MPSPPAIAVQILKAVRSEESTFESLAQIIAMDPALTAKILGIANSPIYGLQGKVTSVEDVLGVLGLNTLKNIALSFVIAKDMKGDSNKGFDFDQFWQRSITGAVAAQLICKQIDSKQPDIFVMALLQDIGRVILAMCQLDKYLGVMDAYEVGELELCELERRSFDFDHQELSVTILTQWGLPESIIEPIRYHHQPLDAPKKIRTKSQVLNLADQVCAVYYGTRSAQDIRQFKQDWKTFFQVEISEPEELIDEVARQSVEILNSFELDSKGIKPYSQILMEANEQLGALNLSYEQLVMELKQAKGHAEAMASNLRDANETLRDMAYRDGLTGLYNHRSFQEMMDKEVARAVRYKRSFALIMFDLDHFKRVNDTYGHPAGDAMLTAIGELILRAVRTSDFASRYGGEEFVIILPETPVRDALIFAERLRKAIEELEVKTGEHTLKVTTSLGVTGFTPSENNPDKKALIEAADKALYASKNKGRNQINAILL